MLQQESTDMNYQLILLSCKLDLFSDFFYVEPLVLIYEILKTVFSETGLFFKNKKITNKPKTLHLFKIY